MELSRQRGCGIEDRTSLDDCKSRGMRGVVSKRLRKLVGVGGWGVLGWRHSIYAQRNTGSGTHFLVRPSSLRHRGRRCLLLRSARHGRESRHRRWIPDPLMVRREWEEGERGDMNERLRGRRQWRARRWCREDRHCRSVRHWCDRLLREGEATPRLPW